MMLWFGANRQSTLGVKSAMFAASAMLLPTKTTLSLPS